MGPFRVTVEHLGGTVLLRPSGELDMTTAPALERALEGVVGKKPSVLLDLGRVSFADCAGLRPIRRALQQGPKNMTSVRVFGAQPRVERVLSLTGLQRSLSVDDGWPVPDREGVQLLPRPGS
jgi:anti-sigma B factor antagonist